MLFNRISTTQKVFMFVLFAVIIAILFGGGILCDFLTLLLCPILRYQPNFCSTFRMENDISIKGPKIKSIESPTFNNLKSTHYKTTNDKNLNPDNSTTDSAGGTMADISPPSVSPLQSRISNKNQNLDRTEIQTTVGGDHVSEENWEGSGNIHVYNKAEPNSDLSQELEDAQFMLESPLAPGEDLQYNLVGPMLYKDLDLVYCGITKTAHSQFRALFCHALREPGNFDFRNDPYRSHSDKECKRKEIIIYKEHSESLKTDLQSPAIRYLATVRDPVDRFISAYIDKCIRESSSCYNCTRLDLICFSKKNQEKMQNLSSGKEKYGTFNHSINHFYPQFWSCDFQATLERYDYLFHYNDTEEFREEVRHKMLEFGVPNTSISVGWGENGTLPFMSVSTSHASDAELANQVKSQIYNDLNLLNDIFETYYIDYRKFNFAIPPNADQLCEKEPDNLTLTICRYVERTRNNDD